MGCMMLDLNVGLAPDLTPFHISQPITAHNRPICQVFHSGLACGYGAAQRRAKRWRSRSPLGSGMHWRTRFAIALAFWGYLAYGSHSGYQPWTCLVCAAGLNAYSALALPAEDELIGWKGETYKPKEQVRFEHAPAPAPGWPSPAVCHSGCGPKRGDPRRERACQAALVRLRGLLCLALSFNGLKLLVP